MAKKQVDVADEAGTIRAHPGVQSLSITQRDNLVIGNVTGRTIWVWFPESIFDAPNPRSIDDESYGEFPLKLDAVRPGFYPYAIYLSGNRERGGAGGQFAIGNSAPGVIITP